MKQKLHIATTAIGLFCLFISFQPVQTNPAAGEKTQDPAALTPDSINNWVMDKYRRALEADTHPEEIISDAIKNVYWPDTLGANGKLYMLMGYFLHTQSRFNGARIYYEKAVYIFENIDSSFTKSPSSSLYKPLGNTYTRIGDNEKAGLYLKKAMQKAVQSGEFIENLYELNKVAANNGHPEEAIVLLRQCLDSVQMVIRQGRFDQFAPVDQHYWLAMIANEQAERHLHTGRTELAMEYAENAMQLTQRVTLPEWKEQITANCQITFGGIYTRLNQLVPAEKSYKLGINLLDDFYKNKNKQSFSRECAKARVELAEFYFKTNRLEDAMELSQEALKDVLPGYSATDPMLQPAIDSIYVENVFLQVQELKGRLFYTQYQQKKEKPFIDAAIASLEMALAAGDTLRAYQEYEASRSAALEYEYPATELLIKSIYVLQTDFNDPSAARKAFSFAEQKKALSLRQHKTFESGLKANAPDLYRQYREAWAKAADLRALLKEHPGNQELHTLLTTAGSDLRRIIQTAEKQYNVAAQPPAMSPEDIQSQLAARDAVLLEYFYCPSDSVFFGWKMDKSGLVFEKIRCDMAVLQEFTQHLDSMNFWAANRAALSVFRTQSESLYETFITPLGGGVSAERMIVSADGPLNSLPFDLLIAKRNNPVAASDFSQLPYLLCETAITTSPCASLALNENAGAEKITEKSYLGITPYYSGYDNWLDSVRKGNQCVQKVMQHFDRPDMQDGWAATPTAFCQMAPRYNVIHFYGHAGTNSERAKSVMAFSHPVSNPLMTQNNPPATQTSLLDFKALPQEYQGSLLAEEDIAELQLNAALVVLSACETGVGDYKTGEGIYSLGRSFYYAGCQSTVLSLWKLDDPATATITEKFFELLSEGLDKDVALQKAKLYYLSKGGANLSPNFWAGIVLMGDNSPVFSSSKKWYYIAAGVFGVLLLGLYYRRNKGKSAI